MKNKANQPDIKNQTTFFSFETNLFSSQIWNNSQFGKVAFEAKNGYHPGRAKKYP